MTVDWKSKLSSRKFWALIAAFAVAFILLLGGGADVVEKVSGAIVALGSAVAYIFAEGRIDERRAEAEADNWEGV